MEKIVKNAINTIKSIKGVEDVREISDEDRETLLGLESSRKGDIIPVINKGLAECIKRQHLLVLLKNCDFRSAPDPTILLVTDKGRILGQELISSKQKEKYQRKKDTYFLGNDFVMFKRDKNLVMTESEKQFFVLPPVPFPELDSIEGIEDVVSCSPSTIGDYFLKNRYNYPDDPKFATILVGFSVKVK